MDRNDSLKEIAYWVRLWSWLGIGALALDGFMRFIWPWLDRTVGYQLWLMDHRWPG